MVREHQSSLAFFKIALLLPVAFVLGAAPSLADTYFNSSEPGCDGSDPNKFFCDDFEDGDYVVTDCDHGGPDDPQNDGWCGTIYYKNDPAGTNFGRCGGVGAAGSSCAASTGVRAGGTTAFMADHNLRGKSRTDELYVRYYTRLLPGFQWGHEKMLTLNEGFAGVGGIKWGTLSAYFGSGLVQYYLPFEDKWLSQNQGNAIKVTNTGTWYLIELHVKLNTPGSPNGIYELWIDDCGNTGNSCPANPTLRARHTNVQFRGAGDNGQIGSVWMEAWANPVSSGETYIDQVVASRTRVGAMGSSLSNASLPPAPFLLE